LDSVFDISNTFGRMNGSRYGSFIYSQNVSSIPDG
jgi:hypothetical protein